MGRSKSKKQQAKAKLDEPGPDDFTYLAVFFPVGRNGAALAKEYDPADKAAAERIGLWMHHAGLPIRKLFSRKSEEHVLVEVREEIPQDVIESKLGAYRWGDMLHEILPQHRDSESTIMRAKVRSHDAVEKMGGMVFFPIPRIVPDGPRALSRFKDPFPQPRKYGFTEPSQFSAIKYIPLPPQLTFTPQEDVKPRIDNGVEETKPDIKPNIRQDVKPNIQSDIKPNLKLESSQDIKPSVETEELKPILNDGQSLIPNLDMHYDDPDAGSSTNPEARPPQWFPVPEFDPNAKFDPNATYVPNVDMNYDDIETKPGINVEVQPESSNVAESNPNHEVQQPQRFPVPEFDPKAEFDPNATYVPNVDMNYDDVETKPEINAETRPETSNGALITGTANVTESDTNREVQRPQWFPVPEFDPTAEFDPNATYVPNVDMNYDDVETKPRIETTAEPQTSNVTDSANNEARPDTEANVKTENATSLTPGANLNNAPENLAESRPPLEQAAPSSHVDTEARDVSPLKSEANEDREHPRLPAEHTGTTSQSTGSKRPLEEASHEPGEYDEAIE